MRSCGFKSHLPHLFHRLFVLNVLIYHMRKCRNWQTSKTKDLVSIALVWVQVPSSAFNLSRKMLIVAVFSGFFIIHFSKKGQKRGRVFSLLVFFIQLFHFPCFPLLFLLLHLELSLFCHQTYDSQFVENL